MFKGLYGKLTDSSMVLLVVGGISLVLDVFGMGTMEYKLTAAVGMALWIAIMVFQNQCLGPNNCSTYSWMLVVLLCISLAMKIYFVNIKGMTPQTFKQMTQDYGMVRAPIKDESKDNVEGFQTGDVTDNFIGEIVSEGEYESFMPHATST